MARRSRKERRDGLNVLLISVQRNLDILGLKGLHHHLLSHGHASCLLYLPRFDARDEKQAAGLREFVRSRQPGLIGISLMAIDYEYARALTQQLRRDVAGVPILWGGIHPTTAPEACLADADYVCVGEGEQTLLDACGALERGEPLREVNNLCYLENGTLRRNPLYPLIEDLDRLAFCTQLPPDSFLQAGSAVRPLSTADLRRHKRYRGGVYKILTSRGCPYACTYCVNSFLRRLYDGASVRRRGVQHVMAELEAALQEGPPVEYVDFTDDCFLACGMAYLEAFCREYKARIRRPFIVKGTPKYFTREKLALLVDAGLVWANMGLQSGSDRVCREIYGRRISSDEFVEATRAISAYPIAAYYDVIVDNPFETAEDALATAETLMRTPRPFYTLIFSLNFYLGTALYDRAAAECPEHLDGALGKDYRAREKRATTRFIEMAGLLPRPLLRGLLNRFRRAPEAVSTRMLLILAHGFSQAVLAPLSFLRLIRRTQGGSWLRTLRVLPVYFRDGIVYFTGSLKWLERS